MKYNDWKAFEKHLQSAFPDHLSSVYLLFGKEEFLKNRAEEAVVALLSAKLPIIRYDGQSADERLLDAELNGFDLFSSSRLIVIANCDKLNKNASEILQSYFPKANKDLPIVLIASSINANTNFYKKAEKFGVVYSADPPKPKELEAICIDWAIQKAHKLGKKLSPVAAQLLYRHLGADWHSLSNELDKLALYCGSAASITEKEIVELVKAVPQATSWQAGEAILRGNTAEAINICHNLLQSGTNLIALIRQLRYTIQTSYDMLSLPEEEISKHHPGTKSFVLEKKLELARQFGLDRFRAAVIALDTSEFAAKDAMGDDELIMEMLIVKLISGITTPLKIK